MALTSARIRALNAVYETGSFSAAAKRLEISQPSAAQLVRDLERDFSVQLFDRRGNGLNPTALCQRLYAVTAGMQERESEAIRILMQHRELKEGQLRIGLGNSMPGMTYIGAFQRAYPGVQVQVEMGSWSRILNAVVDQRVDVAVLPDVPDDGRFRRQVCLNQGVVALVHPNHALARRQAVSCRELANHHLIFRSAGSSTQRVVDKAFRSVDLTPRPSMILDTRDGVFEAVANNLGIGFMWEQGSSRQDQIRKLNVLEMADKRPEYVFALQNRSSVMVNLFFDVLKIS